MLSTTGCLIATQTTNPSHGVGQLSGSAVRASGGRRVAYVDFKSQKIIQNHLILVEFLVPTLDKSMSPTFLTLP